MRDSILNLWPNFSLGEYHPNTILRWLLPRYESSCMVCRAEWYSIKSILDTHPYRYQKHVKGSLYTAQVSKCDTSPTLVLTFLFSQFSFPCYNLPIYNLVVQYSMFRGRDGCINLQDWACSSSWSQEVSASIWISLLQNLINQLIVAALVSWLTCRSTIIIL